MLKLWYEAHLKAMLVLGGEVGKPPADGPRRPHGPALSLARLWPAAETTAPAGSAGESGVVMAKWLSPANAACLGLPLTRRQASEPRAGESCRPPPRCPSALGLPQ